MMLQRAEIVGGPGYGGAVTATVERSDGFQLFTCTGPIRVVMAALAHFYEVQAGEHEPR